ncbi:hypothetical protein Drose_16375 [Dactylosporangium roseum]|uniref:Uncharacterized protein n=1 Tax=Dactylosporangium roseum TaxID=47989 RepID=A0ABY5ZC00_9ACTN|nr:hypothetical protein [Dactylosporangium roseum]UWZ39653.1 hypothetical protein Drose_16375 [Dactylosporangium roseum]
MVDIADTHSTADRGLPGTTTNPQVPDGNLERDVTGYRRTDPDGVAWATDAGDRRTSVSAPAARRSATGTRYLLAAIRLALGRIFLRAFLDKTFGLGHDTAVATSGLNGGAPPRDFPAPRRRAPFAGFYHAIAGAGVTDGLFMAALPSRPTVRAYRRGWVEDHPGSGARRRNDTRRRAAAR